MQSFLDEVAARLYTRYGEELADRALLFPSRRARLFFTDSLSRIVKGPIWQPQWVTIDDLMSEISGLRIGERVRLITELYKVYSSYHEEAFDKFYFWGDMLLADFDTIDKYRIDAAQLFRNIEEIKEIEADISYLTPRQLQILKFWSSLGPEADLTAEKRRFLAVWRTLGPVYEAYRKRLRELGIAYGGMVQRAAAERIAAGDCTLDPSRPTVAVSDKNGDINFITEMIVWRQAVGWAKGHPHDLHIWLEQLGKSWSHLRSAIQYGAPGVIGHASAPLHNKPTTHRMPEERQTLFHEEYARCLQNDSLLWGVWVENMFDFGSVRGHNGTNAMGLMTIDRRRRKDAYYLYKAMWNKEEPTLHIAGKHSSHRTSPQQTFRVYSSAGEPLMTIGGDTVRLTRYADCQYRSDTVTLTGRAEVKVRAGKLRDSTTVLIDSAPAPKSSPVLPQTANPQKTN